MAAATQLSHENRSTTTQGKKEHVGRWRRTASTKQNYLPQVLLISDEFEIPQLNRTRKMGVTSRYDDSEERYPVMYLPPEFVQ
jgi:hypothetical protein